MRSPAVLGLAALCLAGTFAPLSGATPTPTPLPANARFLGGLDTLPATTAGDLGLDPTSPGPKETPGLHAVERIEVEARRDNLESFGSTLPATEEVVSRPTPYRPVSSLAPSTTTATDASGTSALPAMADTSTPSSGSATAPSSIVSTSLSSTALALAPIETQPAVLFFTSSSSDASKGSYRNVFNPGGTGFAGEKDYRQTLQFRGGGVFYFDFVSNAEGTELLTDMLSSPYLHITADDSTPFTIVLGSFNASGQATAFGTSLFDVTKSQQWTLVCTDRITGFQSSAFLIDASRFLTDTQGGTFSVTAQGDQLVLNFTPVPEPATWVMMCGALAGAVGLARRRRHR